MKIYGKFGLLVKATFTCLSIKALPEQNVQIHGVLDQYNYGDNISVVCKSGKSWPELRLQWFINNVLVSKLK